MMLEVRAIHVHYGSIHALQGTTLDVNSGEIVGLVGHNGVGKSTLLRAIAGLVELDSGGIRYQDRDFEPAPADAVRNGISYVPEDRRIFAGLSVEENLRLGATIRKGASAIAESIERELERFPMLREALSKPAGDLSGGQQQMLTIARALVSAPRLLLLDEPSLGLAPNVTATLFETLADLRHDGVTVLLVEQNVAKTVELADRTYVMTPGGNVPLHGTREELERIPDFQRHYLRLSNGRPAGATT